MAKAAPKKKADAKKATRKSAPAPAKKKAAPAKVAGKKAAAPKKAATKTVPKRPASPAPAKKKAAPAAAKRPVGRPPAKKKAAAAKLPAKRPASRPAAKKAAPPAKGGRPAAKKAAPQKAQTKKAEAKRAAPRKVASTKAAPRKPAQSFTVSHVNEADFRTDGLRAYAQYRDLGIATATHGLCQAHVIRLIPPCTDEVRKRHIHETELQLIYVLKGWIKNEFEGHGEQMMSAGTCWLQPPGIKHTVLDYSPDCEMLEIIVPADFKTREVA